LSKSNWLRKAEGFERYLKGLADDPPLTEDEWLMRSGGAAWVRGVFTTNTGYLWLTNKRIIFRASLMSWNGLLPDWSRQRTEIRIEEIESVGKMRRLGTSCFLGGYGLMMPIFTVHLRDGRDYAFQTTQVEAWRSQIIELGGRVAHSE
jgi:hypothetical protein